MQASRQIAVQWYQDFQRMTCPGPITRVEVSTDDGLTWQDARLRLDPEHPWAWCAWDLGWDARPGEYVLVARATDRQGNTQPTPEPWNRGGFANNLVHRVPSPACLNSHKPGQPPATASGKLPAGRQAIAPSLLLCAATIAASPCSANSCSLTRAAASLLLGAKPVIGCAPARRLRCIQPAACKEPGG
jgi:hypothetical protein